MKKYQSRIHLKPRMRQRLSFKAMMAICSTASMLVIGFAGLNLTSEEQATAGEDKPSSPVIMQEQRLVNDFSIPEPVIQPDKHSTSTIFFQKVKPLNRQKNDHEE